MHTDEFVCARVCLYRDTLSCPICGSSLASKGHFASTKICTLTCEHGFPGNRFLSHSLLSIAESACFGTLDSSSWHPVSGFFDAVVFYILLPAQSFVHLACVWLFFGGWLLPFLGALAMMDVA